ncbi:hypothetical protein MKK70_02065 [Methylobacterium sp. E-041]|uniref:hypothetical protein n=1 Tax=unclassified Methylobacterium TaxID=2615210 RepID=UPI0011CBBEE0|nr:MULTISPECIES: hypothetical protein [unclassified Methylobacterium]MCJ2008339.1 hypothetical protein [Methylobacterium sp. J-092]MCJ2104185.1 hypothetical protein [Methylobacterium sp. E-041]TXN71512.1 hypothetical protein FV230_08240 [Methylobacterium sp. WL6]
MIAESNRCRCDETRGQAAVEQALTRAFWHALDGQGLSVMAALEAASRTIGVLYGQIAAAHGAGTTCTCGWVPDPDTDLIVLEAHLAAALLQPRAPDLARMEAAGSA